MNERARVVVTGMGIVSPVGLNLSSAWADVVAGRSGIRRITLFDASGDEWPVKIAGEAWGFDPLDHMTSRDARRADRSTQFALVAAEEAVAQARLHITPAVADDIGVMVGTGSGGIWTFTKQHRILLEKGPARMSPLTVPLEVVDAAGVQISIRYGVHGPNFGIASACASSADAIGMAVEAIRRGDAQAMIAGGAEAAVHPLGIAGFDNLGALSRRNDTPHAASRPFDAERDGFVLSEGAAVLVLESLEFARGRGAQPLAEILAYAGTADGAHFTAPDPSGTQQARAIRVALAKAGLDASAVGYINAHAAGTPVGDPIEVRAYRSVFGDDLPPVSSTKSVTGHLLGAAGAAEAIWTIEALRSGMLPPTINYRTPDPECPLDCVAGAARPARFDVAMSAAFGFGGHNTILVFGRFPG